MANLNDVKFEKAIKKAFDGGSKRSGKNGRRYTEIIDPSHIFLVRIPKQGIYNEYAKRVTVSEDKPTHKKIKMVGWDSGARFDLKLMKEIMDILNKAGESAVKIYLHKTDFPVAICGENTNIEFLLAPRIEEEPLENELKKVFK